VFSDRRPTYEDHRPSSANVQLVVLTWLLNSCCHRGVAVSRCRDATGQWRFGGAPRPQGFSGLVWFGAVFCSGLDFVGPVLVRAVLLSGLRVVSVLRFVWVRLFSDVFTRARFLLGPCFV
jgi:hypothetical protein